MNATLTVAVNFGPHGGGYEVRIGAGLLDRTLPECLAGVCSAYRYALIADSTVAELHAGRVLGSLRQAGMEVELFVFPAGEANKNRESWIQLSDALLASGFGRDAAVLALGGGVTGDLAGFVAATYMRGLPFVQLPTSLLAMIDASVGGKTGVDTPAGKNLIGAFHQPQMVIADTSTLATLPSAELRSGLAEAVKHGAISDRSYFEWIAGHTAALLARDDEPLNQLIGRSVAIKAEVVGADEREGGVRKILNFGHTIGHAIETRSDFSLLHGEAIAIGMVAEAVLGEGLGITEPGTAAQLRSVFSRLGLPTTLPADFTAEEILRLTGTDKKARSGRVEYALIERIGTPHPAGGRYGIAVEDDSVRSALEEVRA